MNLQLIKNNFYKITTMIAILALIAMQIHTQVKAQDGTNVEQQIETNQKTDDGQSKSPDRIGALLGADNDSDLSVLPLLPAMDCSTALQTEPPSETYNPNLDFDVSFIPSYENGKFFQDINGDNLPDFVYIKNSVSGGSSSTVMSSESCVYLNDGNGFSKAYDCSAHTEYNNGTGQITTRLYRGVCAGQPQANSIQ